MAHVHLVIGPVGAGKSTLAQALAAQPAAGAEVVVGGTAQPGRQAVVLDSDRAFATLCLADRPPAGGLAWYAASSDRCAGLLLSLADAVLDAGVDVVLELGLVTRIARERVLDRFTARAQPVTVWVVDAPAPLRWARVQARNRDPNVAFVVPEADFRRASAAWEPPAPSERPPPRHGASADPSRVTNVERAGAEDPGAPSWVHVRTDRWRPSDRLPAWERPWSPPPRTARHGAQLPSYAVAHPEHGVLHLAVGSELTHDTVQRLLTSAEAAVSRLTSRSGALRQPVTALFDATFKSFADLAAQRALSDGGREALAGVDRVVLVSPAADALMATNPDVWPGAEAAATLDAGWRRAADCAAVWPSVALLAGGTGAGKSTLARWARARLGVVSLTLDAWTTALYGPERPEDAGFDWHMTRIARVESWFRELCLQLAACGLRATLDCGFTTRAHRLTFLRWARTAGLDARVVFVDQDADTRWRRVQARNATRGPTWSMDVTRDQFDFMEGILERPDAAEVASCADPAAAEGDVLWVS